MDTYNIQRFLDAQEHSYNVALSEISNGRKYSHWIWYIFPQLRGLGSSYMSNYYGISSLDEARAYLDNPILMSRLIEISTALLKYDNVKTAEEILGPIDARKVCSSMTLFDLVMPNSVFSQVLDAFYDGHRDGLTLRLLNM